MFWSGSGRPYKRRAIQYETASGLTQRGDAAGASGGLAVHENRIDVVRFLLEHDCNPLDLWMDRIVPRIDRERPRSDLPLFSFAGSAPTGAPSIRESRRHFLRYRETSASPAYRHSHSFQ